MNLVVALKRADCLLAGLQKALITHLMSSLAEGQE